MAANVAISELGMATAAMSVGRDVFAKYQNMATPMIAASPTERPRGSGMEWPHSSV